MSSSLLDTEIATDSPVDSTTDTTTDAPATPADTSTSTAGTPAHEQTGVTTEKTAVVADLADALGRTMRTMQRAKAHFIAHDSSGTDWSAHVALSRIVVDGPQRVSALAELTHCDASTVSRQVAGMVKDGFIERQADPQDGRASLLVATDKGRESVATYRAHRDQEFAQMLEDWSMADCDALASLLSRFAGRLQERFPNTTSTATFGAAASREEN